MDMTPAHVITVLSIFIGFHILALPLFVWALRHRQFSGAEQRAWSLDEVQETTTAPAAKSTLNTRQSRWMVGTLSTLAIAMLGSIVLVLGVALHGTAPAVTHPTTGSCPFKF